MRFLTLFMVLTVMLSSALIAQEFKEPNKPATLEKIAKQGAQIFYLGEYENMHGWAVVRKGKPEIFYENKDRTALVMGMMFNEAGEMVTMAQLTDLYNRVGDDMYAVTGGLLEKEPDETDGQATTEKTKTVQKAPEKETNNRPLTPAEIMYTDLLSWNWLTMNKEGDYDLFAFIDPDCPHCMTFINNVQPYLTDDGLRIRILPIGLNPDSLRKSSVLLASADPADKLKAYAAGDESALKAPQNISIEAVETNLSLMTKHGFDATPIIVYRTSKGEIRLIRGRPANLDTVMEDIIMN